MLSFSTLTNFWIATFQRLCGLFQRGITQPTAFHTPITTGPVSVPIRLISLGVLCPGGSGARYPSTFRITGDPAVPIGLYTQLELWDDGSQTFEDDGLVLMVKEVMGVGREWTLFRAARMSGESVCYLQVPSRVAFWDHTWRQVAHLLWICNSLPSLADGPNPITVHLPSVAVSDSLTQSARAARDAAWQRCRSFYRSLPFSFDDEDTV